MSLPGLTLKHPLLPRKLNRTVLIDGLNSGRRLTCIKCISFPRASLKVLGANLDKFFTNFLNASWPVL